MKNNKLLCSFLFVFVFCFSYAQDLIIKRDSSVIFCKIIKEDSTSIYYRQSKGEQTFELNIKKTDVLNYYSRRANAINEVKRTDSIARAQVKKDSILPKPVAVILPKDSIEIKKDKLPQKLSDAKPQGDTIALNVYYKCFYKGELITRGEALKLMKGNTEAHNEMKKARACFAPVVPLGIGALVTAGVFVSNAVSNGNFHWVVGGSGILLTAIAITLKQACNTHMNKAVKFYNTKPSILGARARVPKYELGMAFKGIGLCLKF